MSVMPCTAKKFECKRPEMKDDVDVVITVMELAKMIRTAGIDFDNLEDAEFDVPFGLGSGAAQIFGITGGVMEAAETRRPPGRNLPQDVMPSTRKTAISQSANPTRTRMYSRSTKNFWGSP